MENKTQIEEGADNSSSDEDDEVLPTSERSDDIFSEELYTETETESEIGYESSQMTRRLMYFLLCKANWCYISWLFLIANIQSTYTLILKS